MRVATDIPESSVRAWVLVALVGLAMGIAGALLGMLPTLRPAAFLMPVGALIWWGVGEFGPKPEDSDT